MEEDSYGGNDGVVRPPTITTTVDRLWWVLTDARCAERGCYPARPLRKFLMGNANHGLNEFIHIQFRIVRYRDKPQSNTNPGEINWGHQFIYRTRTLEVPVQYNQFSSDSDCSQEQRPSLRAAGTGHTPIPGDHRHNLPQSVPVETLSVLNLYVSDQPPQLLITQSKIRARRGPGPEGTVVPTQLDVPWWTRGIASGGGRFLSPGSTNHRMDHYHPSQSRNSDAWVKMLG
eukprot:gene23108-biopygen2000